MMSSISRGKGKRLHNKEEVDKMNRTALIVGGVSAACILVLMVISFFMA